MNRSVQHISERDQYGEWESDVQGRQDVLTGDVELCRFDHAMGSQIYKRKASEPVCRSEMPLLCMLAPRNAIYEAPGESSWW